MMSDTEIEAVVREVTDEEVTFYREHGWVMLRALVDTDFAAELLAAGLAYRETVGGRTELMARPPTGGMADEERKGSIGLEPYRSLMFSERMAQNAQRLLDRRRLKGIDVPLRYRYDNLVLKAPGAKGTSYHQDASEHGSDRGGELQFWLALAEVKPEMGAMRFVDKSHLEGPLGSTFNGDDDGGFNGAGNLLQQYPNLVSESLEELREHTWPPTATTGGVLKLTEPFHYQPGDCTLHHGWCVHGGPDNTTTDSRWSYLFSYTCASHPYTYYTVDDCRTHRVVGD
jgi:hypothetical protein